MLPADSMPEAEVTLRLALHLLGCSNIEGDVYAAIDGAQVRVRERTIFAVREFLTAAGLEIDSDNENYRGSYSVNTGAKLHVHSHPGEGDVTARTASGRRLWVECKKGPLIRSSNSVEYPLIREAIGQLMTLETACETDVLAVAVPHSAKFAELAERWRGAPLMAASGIQIVLVGRNGTVDGLDLPDG